MQKPLHQFRRRRRVVSLGAFTLGLSVILALVTRFSFPDCATLFVGVGVGLYAAGALQYRCPFCSRFPEADIPTFYPARCSRCGKRLR